MAVEAKVLHVEGMSCSHCENRIKKVVGALNGVSSVSVDLKGKKVTVEYDPEKTVVDAMRAAIEDQGCDVM